jgi:hypothetical protein
MSEHKLSSNSKKLNLSFLLKLLFSAISIFIIIRFILKHFELFYEGIQDIRFIFMAFLFPIVINPIFSNLRWQVFFNVFDVRIKFVFSEHLLKDY